MKYNGRKFGCEQNCDSFDADCWDAMNAAAPVNLVSAA